MDKSDPIATTRPKLDRLATWIRKYDQIVYLTWALACTVFTSALFYGYMLGHTGGTWSAPLDDVFIHFDYARSLARGYLFHWSEGNGYSSGNSSLTYSVVLAAGYWIGFRQLSLMIWAALLANIGMVVFLFGSGRLVDGFASSKGSPPTERSRWMKYLLPPAVLSMGALDWTVFSGMENGWHLGVWGMLALAARHQWQAADQKQLLRRSWLTGAVGAFLVATRPESGVCVAAFAFFGAWQARSLALKRTDLLRVIIAVGLPGVLLLLAHTVTNYTLTGEWSANGSIAKVFLNNPFMTTADKWQRYKQLLGYIVPRLIGHHFADAQPWGWLVPIVAVGPLLSRKTRPIAILLWTQLVGWLLLVSVNNQLRWHNERYAMPPVAWLMLLAALGLATFASRGEATSPPARRWLSLWRRGWLARAGFAIVVAAVYWQHQAPRMNDQVWFFARASRNILDQHVRAGRLLKKLGIKRVLVGDAGALTYTSDRPGLDLIGLGGYHAFPFARSGVHGLGASLELIERIAPADRPDIMAIYPSWWGELPTQFGHFLMAVPVAGNVICGGAEKVLYRADWRALDRQGRPRSLREGEKIVDELDFADLLSERNHDYDFPRPRMGFVSYRLLRDPNNRNRDLFDAGRLIPANETAGALMRAPRRAGRLILRVAPEHPVRIEVLVNGQVAGQLDAKPRSGAWQELSLRLPTTTASELRIGLRPVDAQSIHYHLWIVE